MASIGTLFVDIKAKLGDIAGQVSSEIGKVKSVIDREVSGVSEFAKRNQEAFGNMAKAGGVAFAAISGGIGLTINSASDLTESINAVNVVFGEAAGKIQDFGKQSAVAVGLSTAEFNKLATPIGAALQNVGLSADDAAEQTINLTKRASDMASVFNVDVRDALGAIQAGLRGEADPLERFGVNLSETSIKAFALANGLIASGKEMTVQEKTVARLGLLYQQTSKLEGDFANTSDQLANSKRILAAQFTNISATIGTAFLPVIQQVVTAIRPVIDSVAQRVSQNPELTKNILLASLAIAALVTVIGTLGLVMPSIIAGFLFISSALSTVGLAFIAVGGPITVLIALITALVVAVYKNWDLIVLKTNEMRLLVTEAFSGNTEAIATILETAIRIGLAIVTLGLSEIFIKFAGGWENVKAKTFEVFDGIRTRISGVFESIKSVVESVVTYIVGKIDSVLGVITKIQAKITDFKNAIGDGFSNIGFRAEGGPVSKNMPYIVGEKGPELFVPNGGGRIIPNNQITNNYNVNVTGNGINSQSIANNLGFML